jgi:hypothetical protein
MSINPGYSAVRGNKRYLISAPGYEIITSAAAGFEVAKKNVSLYTYY